VVKTDLASAWVDWSALRARTEGSGWRPIILDTTFVYLNLRHSNQAGVAWRLHDVLEPTDDTQTFDRGPEWSQHAQDILDQAAPSLESGSGDWNKAVASTDNFDIAQWMERAISAPGKREPYKQWVDQTMNDVEIAFGRRPTQADLGISPEDVRSMEELDSRIFKWARTNKLEPSFAWLLDCSTKMMKRIHERTDAIVFVPEEHAWRIFPMIETAMGFSDPIAALSAVRRFSEIYGLHFVGCISGYFRFHFSKPSSIDTHWSLAQEVAQVFPSLISSWEVPLWTQPFLFSQVDQVVL
jgi:hypothetical protein